MHLNMFIFNISNIAILTRIVRRGFKNICFNGNRLLIKAMPVTDVSHDEST